MNGLIGWMDGLISLVISNKAFGDILNASCSCS